MYERGIDLGIGSLTYPFIITMEHMRWSRHVLIIDVTLFICVIMFAENQINEGSKSLYWFCIDFIESKISAVLSVFAVLYQYIPTSKILIPTLCMYVYSSSHWIANSEGYYTKYIILSCQSLLIQITNTAIPSCLCSWKKYIVCSAFGIAI